MLKLSIMITINHTKITLGNLWSIYRKSITPSVLEGREEHFLESRGTGGQMKHVFEIPLGTGAGKTQFIWPYFGKMCTQLVLIY